MTPFGDGMWLDTAPVSVVGAKLSVTMSVLRLADDALLVYSPLALTPERKAAAEKLGVVRHLYAPNLYHHLHMGDWATAFPEARVHAPVDLDKKRPDLRIDRVHGGPPEPAFADVVEELPVDGCRLGETALFYPRTGTLVVADLVHNVGRPAQRWAAIYTRIAGFYDRVAISRVLRWTAFSDRRAARASIDRMIALPFDRMVVGHGAPLEAGAREALATAYSWLPAAA